jgi:adenylylsulfate kinase-like enzyme
VVGSVGLRWLGGGDEKVSTSKCVQNRRMVIVICGPIASGKSTVARAVARLFERLGTEAAVVDLDLVYETLEHDGAAKNRREKWSRARRAAAALTDGLLDDGVGAVVVEGDFLREEERAEFLTALRSRRAPLFVTVHVLIDVALQRVQQDRTRGISRDPRFLRAHYEQLEDAIRCRPPSDLIVDTGSVDVAEAARTIVEWASNHASTL